MLVTAKLIQLLILRRLQIKKRRKRGSSYWRKHRRLATAAGLDSAIVWKEGVPKEVTLPSMRPDVVESTNSTRDDIDQAVSSQKAG